MLLRRNPLLKVICNFHVSSVRFHYLFGNRKSQSCSFSFGRKERGEDGFSLVERNTASMVTHIDNELTLFPVAGYAALAVESAFRSKSEISSMWKRECPIKAILYQYRRMDGEITRRPDS